MELRHLRYFAAVVEHGGFRAASRALYVAQPAISSTLRQLEAELDVTLLHRSTHGIELTDAGREFMSHAYTMLGHEEAAKSAMRAWAPQPQPQPRLGLRIGAIAGILSAGELTTPILREYRDAHPELETTFKQLPFGDQVKPILSGVLDAAIVRGPVTDPDLEYLPIASERRALLVAAGHLLAEAQEVDVHQVLDFRTLPLSAPGAFCRFWQLDAERGRSNAHPRHAPVSTIAEMQRVVGKGTCVITVPDSMSRLAPSAAVCSVGLPDAIPSTISIAWRRGDRRREVATFVDEAAQTAERSMDRLLGAHSPSS